MSIGTILSTLPRRRRARRFECRYENVLGTSLELQLLAANGKCAQRAELEVLAEVDRLEAILSTYSSTSEFVRWQGTFDVDVPVSNELAEVLGRAEMWRHRTAGAFDPGVRSIIDALQQRGGASAQGADVVDAQRLEPTGLLWRVDPQAGTARCLTRRAATLDAIAKGYIVSAAAVRALGVPGITDAVVNIGGDLQHHGAKSIRVQIADPFAPEENADPIALVRIRDQALATSGSYRRHIIVGGRPRSHIVDPLTGCPAELVRSASVIAPDCTTADVLSTAFSVLKPERSLALADAIAGVACLLVLDDRSVVTSARWWRHDTASLTDHDTCHEEIDE